MAATPAAKAEQFAAPGSRIGPIRARDLDAAQIPRAYLTRLCERGTLERVERGLYRLAEAPATEHNSLSEVAKRVPHAIGAC
jgi:predicted transcriptional regulator of viral defense system